MKSSRLENNIIKDIRNLFRLKNEINDTATKYMRNLFRLKKENEGIKNRANRDIGKLSEHEEEENYYKLLRVGHFRSNNYIEYECNNNRKKYSISRRISQ